MGCQPHWGGGAGSGWSAVARPTGWRWESEEHSLPSSSPCPPSVGVQERGGLRTGEVRLGQGEAGWGLTNRTRRLPPASPCQPGVWAGIWLWPGRRDVGGGVGLGREPKREAARAEEPQSRALGGEAGWRPPAQHALPAGLGSQLAGAYVQACGADQPPVPLPSPSKRTPEPHQIPAPPQQAGALSPLPEASIPSRLTSVIFSSIHLVIHVHGKFLKKPVAELEAGMGTQALSDPETFGILCAGWWW